MLRKSEVQEIYQEVKRKKVTGNKSQGLMEPRPKKGCGCGGKAKKVKSE